MTLTQCFASAASIFDSKNYILAIMHHSDHDAYIQVAQNKVSGPYISMHWKLGPGQPKWPTLEQWADNKWHIVTR
jgi:hypothetical protein